MGYRRQFLSGSLFRRFFAQKSAYLLNKLSNRLEWFRQVVIRANPARLRFIEGLKRANEEHHWNVTQTIVPFDIITYLVTVDFRHEDVSKDDVWQKSVK